MSRQEEILDWDPKSESHEEFRKRVKAYQLRTDHRNRQGTGDSRRLSGDYLDLTTADQRLASLSGLTYSFTEQPREQIGNYNYQGGADDVNENLRVLADFFKSLISSDMVDSQKNVIAQMANTVTVNRPSY